MQQQRNPVLNRRCLVLNRRCLVLFRPRQPVIGEVVVLPFPQSNLQAGKVKDAKLDDKARAKAFADSRKTAKPLWEEDGQRRSLLERARGSSGAPTRTALGVADFERADLVFGDVMATGGDADADALDLHHDVAQQHEQHADLEALRARLVDQRAVFGR